MEEETETQFEEIDQMAEIEKNKNQFKLFGIYDVSGIKLEDPGLKRYINLDPKLLVKSHGRIREKFSRRKINLIEFFANLVAVPGHRGKKHKIITGWASGKYNKNLKQVLDAFKIIHERTKENPIQVLVNAIENGSPMDEVTIIQYGGARYPQAVDSSPLRRISIALRNISHGAYDKSFNKKKPFSQALAEEIINTAKGSGDSIAVTKRTELEKQADAAR